MWAQADSTFFAGTVAEDAVAKLVTRSPVEVSEL
jgi:hypothetical protein